MKTFILVALISSSFVYALSPEAPVNEQDRRDKFAGVSRIRTWENDKKDALYRDLATKPIDEVAEKYKEDFNKDELKDLKER